MKQRTTVRQRMARRIARTKCEVFLTRDFLGLGSRSQVQRVLCQLVNDGKLLRMGLGVYVRARVNTLTGKLMFDGPGAVHSFRTALDRLGIAWSISQDEIDLIEGRRSTQIAVNPATRVPKGFARKLVTSRGAPFELEH